MHRYEEADDSLVGVFLSVMEERFPKYQAYKFKLIFDLKKRIQKGKLVLASIEAPSAKIRFFSADNIAIEGYDYIMTVDKKAWEASSDKDKVRLISHELNHVFIDEGGTPKIIDHDISDFYIELKRNEDDPQWANNLGIIVSAMYDQEKEESKKQIKQ